MFEARDINSRIIETFYSRDEEEDFANSLTIECFITNNGELKR